VRIIQTAIRHCRTFGNLGMRAVCIMSAEFSPDYQAPEFLGGSGVCDRRIEPELKGWLLAINVHVSSLACSR
jgi:hypothetical protein